MDEMSGNALVTGGSRGIGRACALALAKRGADVAITYIENADAAETTVEEIHELGRRAVALRGDVGIAEDNVTVVEGAIAELDAADIGDPVAFLLSDDARMVTGQTLCVDAGFTLPG